jgi:hypothetical protein
MYLVNNKLQNIIIFNPNNINCLHEHKASSVEKTRRPRQRKTGKKNKREAYKWINDFIQENVKH